jgi:hypothetical protein
VRSLVAATSLWVVLATPVSALGQAGWYVIPAVGVIEEFDDNVFGTRSDRSADLITRFTPRVTGGYRSKPLTLLVTTGLDGELFAEHAELTRVPSRKHASVEFQYVDQPTTFGVTASFVETRTPSELQPQTGIELERQDTTQWQVSPSVVHRFSQTLSGDASYAYVQTEFGAVTSTAHQATLGLSSQITRVDTGAAHYTFRALDSGLAPTTMSHAVTVGWTRRFSPTTTGSIDAGPRLSDGTIEPEIHAALSHRFKIGRASLTYARTETTTLGQAGTAETNTLLAALSLTPARSLQLNVGAGVSDTTSNAGDTIVYRTNASATYRLTRWLSATLAYRFTLQDERAGNIYHNIVSIGLDASYPIRADR